MRRGVVLAIVLLAAFSSCAALFFAIENSPSFSSFPGDPARMPKADIHLVPAYPNIIGKVKYGSLSGGPNSTAHFETQDGIEAVLQVYSRVLRDDHWVEWAPATSAASLPSYERNGYIVDIQASHNSSGTTGVLVDLGMLLK